MSNGIKTLCKHRVFYHFKQICDIPRGSGNEKELSDYILGWAKGLGLDAEQDVHRNVLIRKAATSGFEGAPTVMLQAHLDMVCEKAEGVTHDFLKDPIDWVIEGDVLSTGGKTTLGADDGIGVALAMAVLEDADLRHPALEVLFTSCEEADFSGAEGFDTTRMEASRLINLDNTDESVIVCGSCGGMQVDFHLPVKAEPVPAGWSAYRLCVSGLQGGHSGEDIHRGRGNANILLARLLMAAEECCAFYLSSIRGGSFRLAIPRDAEAVLWLDASRLAEVQTRFAALEAAFRAELPATAELVKVELTAASAVRLGAKPDGIITALVLIPDGIQQMNEVLTGLVDTSDNLGEVYLDLNREELHLVLEIRSAQTSLGEYLFRRMERLAHTLGGSCRWSVVYPSWDFRPASKLRQIYADAYTALRGNAPTFLTVHAGLEVGYFFQTKPQLDAISIGPDCWDFHSPTESLRISSVENVYSCLCSALASMG
ncbi:MAG: beta-Ala-His dipeptidase [Oscillibacter ruminantium]|uniref:beta-Ala-His dipeptidase n=1 Tax=Oscillibacter ruminantium TaxID=1263547 RepID=UPI002B1F7EF2|nr:beta-Ala-His dipeptidase [Oscillibacter ruminantium]MEA5042897.1 beta-Ala-His dipeptidase [Oscillibacter ruminantium]